jgi:hypothetical protein
MDYQREQDKSTVQNIFIIFFCMTLISNLVMYIAQPYHIELLNALASRCFMLTNLAAFFVVILINLRRYNVYQTYQILLLTLIACFSFVSYLLSENIGLYNYIIHIWCYLAFPFYLLYLDYLKSDRRLIHFIFIINFINSLVFINLSFSSLKYAGYESYLGTNNAIVTLGYSNPNQTAMYLVITFITLCCTFFFYKILVVKVTILADGIYLFLLLLKTQSRICIAIGILLLLIILLKRHPKIPKLIVAGVLLSPSIFLIGYSIYYTFVSQLISSGSSKLYDNRGFLFLDTLSAIKNHFLFGYLSLYQLPNTHNGILSIYSSLGIISLLLFYVYMFRAYFHISSRGFTSKSAYIAFWGLLLVFLHACVESAFITAGSIYAGSISMLIYLSASDRR